MTNGAIRRGQRGRQPLPEDKRGETLSCYIPRWAVDRLQRQAEGEQLSRNMLVRRILLDYLGAADGASAGDRPVGRQLLEAKR